MVHRKKAEPAAGKEGASMSGLVDLSQPIETGQPVYPGLAKTLINTWNIDPAYRAHVLAKELDYYHIENLTVPFC